MIFNFDNKFFIKHQNKLLFIANKWYLSWLLGLNRLPKDLKEKHIDKITPNSVHSNIGKPFNKKGKYKQNIKGYFFTRSRFGEALAYNLSPFCYFQELRSPKFTWRFSPMGLIGMFIFGLLLKKNLGFPFAVMGTTTDYSVGSNDGYNYRVGASGESFSLVRSGAGSGVNNSSVVSGSCHRSSTNFFAIWRSFFPIDTSVIPDDATISSAIFYLYAFNIVDEYDDGYGYFSIVTATDPNDGALTAGDYSSVSDTEVHDSGERKDATGLSTVAYTDWTLNATGINSISKTGYTNLACRDGHDITNNAPASTNKSTQARFFNADDATKYPYLSVTYTEPSARRIINIE